MSDYPNARDCEHGQLRRSCERCEDRRTIAVALFVARHWKASALDAGDTPVAARVMAHPLNLVIDALDGVTDPTMLGIEPEAHVEFRRVLSSEEGTPNG